MEKTETNNWKTTKVRILVEEFYSIKRNIIIRFFLALNIQVSLTKNISKLPK